MERIFFFRPVPEKALGRVRLEGEAAYRNELEAFVKAVRNGARPRPDGEDGLRANLLVDAASVLDDQTARRHRLTGIYLT
jgi:predicted dehydrogenase